MTKKICYVNPTVLMKRPIAQVSTRLSKEKEFEVSVFTPRHAFKKRDNSLHYSKLKGVNVIDYSSINPPIQSEWPIPGFEFLVKAIYILKKNDIIHLWVPFYIGSTLIILLNRIFFKKKIILTMDTVPGYSFKMGRIMDHFFKIYCKTLGKLVFPSLDIITTYTHSIKKHFKKAGVPLNKLKVIPNGVPLEVKKKDKDIRKELGIPKDNLIAVFVGILVPRKGIDIILKTAKKLKKEKITFVLVGDGPYGPKYKKYAKENKLTNVIFTGFRKDVHNFYQEGDFLFFPSRGEGLPGVMMEAMSYSLPILGSKIVTVEDDLVFENENGFTCPTEKIKCYSSKVLKMLRNRKILKTFSRNSRKIIEHFTWSSTIKKYKEIYQNG